MKARATLVALALTTGLAVAQDNPPQPAQQTKTEQKTTAVTPSDRPAEMKTMSYKGTLVDLGCGGSQNTAAAAAPGGAEAATSANRSASDAANCTVSTSSSQFGLKMDNGQTVRFDLVGNQRAQDEIKNNKRWNKAVSANQPMKVKVSGVLQGDKLIVSQIH